MKEKQEPADSHGRYRSHTRRYENEKDPAADDAAARFDGRAIAFHQTSKCLSISASRFLPVGSPGAFGGAVQRNERHGFPTGCPLNP